MASKPALDVGGAEADDLAIDPDGLALVAGLLVALALVLLPPWQSTHFTQDEKTRAQVVIGPTPEPCRVAWLFNPPETGYQFHKEESLEVWFVWSVDWSRLTALLLVDALACAVLIVQAGWRKSA